MCLKEYLRAHGMTPQQFARWAGVNPQSVWSWLRGDTRPRDSKKADIFALTNGEIRPEDWFPTCGGK